MRKLNIDTKFININVYNIINIIFCVNIDISNKIINKILK